MAGPYRYYIFCVQSEIERQGGLGALKLVQTCITIQPSLIDQYINKYLQLICSLLDRALPIHIADIKSGGEDDEEVRLVSYH